MHAVLNQSEKKYLKRDIQKGIIGNKLQIIKLYIFCCIILLPPVISYRLPHGKLIEFREQSVTDLIHIRLQY